MVKLLPGLQNGRGETGLVGGIGEKLGFQTEAVAGAVDRALLASSALVQIIGRVELHAGKGGLGGHLNARFPAIGPGGGAQRPGLTVYHIVVVVAPRLDELNKQLLNVCANGGGGAEIHGGALHRGHLPRGDAVRVGGGVVAGKQGDLLLQNRAGTLPAQIKIGVIGQITGGVLVALGLIAQGQGVIIQRISHLHPQMAGVALLHVGAVKGQHGAGLGQLLHPPHLVGKALDATVEVVGAVVDGQCVILPVEGKPTFGDAVGVPPHHSAQISVLGVVFFQCLVAQRHIHGIPRPVGDGQGAQSCAKGEDLTGDGSAAQGQQFHRLPGGGGAKRTAGE